MSDLLQSQIKESCKLALPEGLKDLMSDISREVLRAQPRNVHQFIANYLEALLEVRETLSIACNVCNDMCKCICEPVLTKELKKIGIDQDDIYNIDEIVTKYIENGEVEEQNLFHKMIRKTNIDESQLPIVQLAIQEAYKRHRISGKNILDYEIERNNETSSAQHTLKLYYAQDKLGNETEDIFVAPEYKPCVTTVSSTTLAGSYIHLPIYKPYSAYVPEILSAISERENASLDYALKINNDKENNVKCKGRGIVFKEINGGSRNAQDDKYLENNVVTDDDNDVIEGSDENAMDEVMENIESENESTASSVVESIYDFENSNLDVFNESKNK